MLGSLYKAEYAACRIANGAEEARNPRRDIPLATGLCLGLCTMLYAAASTVIVGERFRPCKRYCCRIPNITPAALLCLSPAATLPIVPADLCMFPTAAVRQRIVDAGIVVLPPRVMAWNGKKQECLFLHQASPSALKVRCWRCCMHLLTQAWFPTPTSTPTLLSAWLWVSTTLLRATSSASVPAREPSTQHSQTCTP